ncbi:MAG: type IV pilus twitching motility protein PilT [Deinococcus sp.]|uniref:type IV pilus twitching motility protein PilT n=1 Tax=Deinococcus sp. TaxID=47478 RepID=UPI0026DB1A03|nr:type IV pilus twitching motility protein PilT [Deinococcus sp.]MDO4246258.1 type IV pilus twitching motility protein PilT [Deinococcus sp.]
MTLDTLLRELVGHRASDIHLQAGSPPMGRVDGKLVPFGTEGLTPADTLALAQQVLSPEQLEDFEYQHELDVAYSVPGLGRFRCNVFRQRGAVGLVLRVVSDTIPGFEALGLPRDVMEQFAALPRGLVLVTGPTGSGKSTSVASLIDYLNRTYSYNILTIEDPIEILHRNRRSLVVQREVGHDTRNFATALKHAMRQDPDVIVVGEMRDQETVEAALSAAQTGHLVISTLHTQDAVRTVNRIVDFFAPHEREQVRHQLAGCLGGIVSQRLLLRADGVGRVLATEVLVGTPLVQEYIKDEERTPLIKDALMEDDIRGMHTFDQHLAELYRAEVITLESALAAATSPHELRLMLTQTQRH